MKIGEALPKAYENLPDGGGKTRAALIYGVSTSNFKKIVNGDFKDESIMYSAYYACLQAAKDIKTENEIKLKSILEIKVDKPELIKPKPNEYTT